MKINTFNQTKDTAVVVLEGDFDALSAPLTRAEFERVVDAGSGDLIVDLSGVTFMDSSGAGALVFLYKRLVGQQRKLQLVGVTGQPLELLDLLRISAIISVNQALVIRPAQREDSA